MKLKLKKTLKILACATAALLLIIILTFLFWLGPTIKLTAQTIGSKALGTEVNIDKLSINPLKGTISLSDFNIQNPDIFGQSNAVSLASLNISVDMASLFSSTILVHQVEINSPHFVYEQNLQRDNITEFIRNVQAFANIDPSAPKPEKEKKPQNKPAPIVIIESLAINDVQMKLANTRDPQLDIRAGLDSLAVSMTNGTFVLNQIYIQNPGRLKTPNLFTLDRIHVEMAPESIYSTNIHFKTIQVVSPQAYVEYNPETDTAGEFLKIAACLAEKIPTNAPASETTNPLAEADAAPDNTLPPPDITLDLLAVDNVQLHAVNISEPDLNTQLSVARFSVALEEGLVEMKNLRLSNPKTLKTPNLFSLENIAVQLEPGSHKTASPVINDVRVTSPHAFLELNAKNNTISEWLRLANGYIERIPTYQIPSLPPAPEKPQTDKPTTAKSDKTATPPLELQHLVVDNIAAHLLDTTDTNLTTHTPRIIAGVDEISAKLIDGRIEINNITVPNHPDFAASNLFHLAQIAVTLDPESLYSDQVVINEVFIDSPQVDLEQTETSGNVASLQSTFKHFTPPGTEDKTPETKPPQPATEKKTQPLPIAEQPVVLHRLAITNLNVNLKLPVTTNHTETAGMSLKSLNPMEQIGKLNPMEQIGKLNPLSSEDEEAEIDPDAPVTMVAFRDLLLQPLEGQLQINGLRIANPPNFSRRDMVKIEHFSLDLDPDSIQSDILMIRDIQLTNPRVRYERQILKDNIKAFQENIEQAVLHREEYTEDTEPGPEMADTSPTAEAEEEQGQKVIIERIAIDGCIVYAKLSALPTLPIPLPLPVLKDIGKEKGGATPAEAATQVYDTFYEEMLSAVSGATGFAGDTLKGLGSLTSDMVSGAKDGVGKITKGNSEIVEGAVEETVEKVKETRKTRRAGGRRRVFP
ncbi:AsmA family protein [Pontiella agarivorans]|uniref:AsmA family protein n=1 Tax=Pontiella agarivorans TaxID=3038953 RepID=A0ABU5MXP2_9BACT|nr:AsmA family protein [Pontiella agarivorans]MDZ8118990.1 AsmA family protein [Pontiella agarivorans]